MHAEINLTNINRKIDVKVMGGSEETIITTVPKRNDGVILFDLNEKVEISCYFNDDVYFFDTEFIGIEKRNDNRFYQFKIIQIDLFTNQRNEIRKNIEHPAAVFNDDELHFATILDISDNGLKIETKRKINHKFVKIRYGKNELKNGEILWSKTEQGKHYYGLFSEIE